MIKLYYNKTTTQFISYDDGGMPIIQGDDGQKEFHIYFDDSSVIGAYNCRVVIERPDGAKSNEIYATPITGVLGGYYKVVVSSWVAEVEGVLKITTRLKAINNEPIVFGVANIPVQFGVDPDENETITDTQYEAIMDAVDGVVNGQTPLSFDQLNLYSGSCTLDFNNKFDCESNGGVWTYADALTVRYNGKDPVLYYRGIEGELFKNLFEEAEPASGVIFTNGMPIMYAGSVGASGKRLAKPTNLVELKDNPQLFLGIVTEVTTEGHAIFNWYGTVSNINTLGRTLGETLYVGDGVLLTHANKPISPLPLISVGIVERVHALGKISVRPDIGRSLGQLHNVYVNGDEVDGITIVYNDETGRYEAYDLKGNIFRIDTEISDIKNGTTIVKKAEQDASGNVITTTYETKAVATSKKAEIDGRLDTAEGRLDTAEGRLDTAEDEIDTLQSTKVPKTTKIIGLDLQDDILIGEFREALGNATQSVAGLLSAEDKTHLDNLVLLLDTDDMNSVIDTIGEILHIFENYPEGANILEVLNGKVDKVAGKGLSTNDYTDVDKNKVNSTYTQQEINALLDNLSAVKGVKSNLLTPTELSNGDTISTNLLTNNGAYIIFTATNVANDEIDSDTVPVSTIVTGKKFVFFDNQEIVFTIGETNSTFETSEDITLKINLMYLDNESVQAVGVEFDGSLTNYLLSQTNVQEAIEKIDNELKTTNDNKVDKIIGKGLSTEDYTTTEKNKLSGIETGAKVNVQSNWTQEVNTADDYIKNKPAIPTKISDLTNDSGFITTETDPIFTAWNKSTGISITKSQVSDLIEATQSLSGLMSATDKQRLDVLHSLLEEDTTNNVVDSINEILAIFNNYPEGANLVTALAGKLDKNNAITAGTKTKITYDSKGLVTSGADLTESDIPTLPASKITQDANNRFVTDNEKSTWNLKQNALTAGDGISIVGDVISAVGGLTVETWNTETKTLALSDVNKLFVSAITQNQTLTIPSNDAVAFPIGTMITFLLLNSNTIMFSGPDVSLSSMDNLVELKTQGAMASLIKINTNVWQLVGALE